MSDDIHNRALGYPYTLPGASYIVDTGVVLPLSAEDMPRHRAGRIPVLAIGSNQSPDQIRRKFSGPDWLPIPCEKCHLENFDTVFSAHITAYGSIAAALHPSPGTRVSLFINWLDESHMSHMHATELGNENYVYARLDGVRVLTEFGHEMTHVYFYRSNAGAYAPKKHPIPLAEVAADNRRWDAMRQIDMQSFVQACLEPAYLLEDFVMSSINQTETRRNRAAAMQTQAIPFQHPGLTVIKNKM